MQKLPNIDKYIPLSFSERERKLAYFAHEQHHPQVRKYTGEPYVTHLLRVAKTVQDVTKNPLCTAGALGHDLLEDTTCTKQELRVTLSDFGYSEEEIQTIVAIIWDLTDRYIREVYPDLNRKARKLKEAERLQDISVLAANVKMADIIDNTTDLSFNDPTFAKKYMHETGLFIPSLVKGNADLFAQLKEVIEAAEWQVNGR